MLLEPNTYTGLLWGLKNFDGIEFDIRLSVDKQLVIYHDPHLPSGEAINKLTLEELEERGIPTLHRFFSIPQIVELSKNRRFYIELKPDCRGKKRIDHEIRETIYASFMSELDQSKVSKDAINIISFVKDLLDPFTEDFPCFPIIPDINECNQSLVMLRALPKFFSRSLTWHMKDAVKRKYEGVFFARQYLIGPMSKRHPSYEKMKEMARDMGLKLGTNLGSVELEPDYKSLYRFTDKVVPYPRHAEKGEGDIIAHRGTGTKGVEVPENEVESIKF